jgi:PAS domain S-box-containing protein
MSDFPSAERHHLEAQLQALRAELARLQAVAPQQVPPPGDSSRDDPSQRRFRTIFDHSPLGQKIIGSDLTIRQANAACADLLGQESPSALRGRTILEFAHPEYRTVWAHLQAALWTHRVPFFAFEACLLLPDGTQRWCRVTSVLFHDAGQELGHTTLEDISDRVRLEAQVQQHTQALEKANEQLAAFSEEMQAANEELLATNAALGKVNNELDTFVYAAAHDLRSPLTNLQGLVQVLERQLPPDSPQQALAKPILAMMQVSLVRLGNTLSGLADFGTAHARAGLPRELVSLARVLEEVRQEVAPQLAATQGQLLVDLAGNPSFWFAPQQVHSVLLNLVSNALKYRHPDRAPVVRVQSFRELGRLVVRVQDNGLGLSTEQQGQLFRLFKRLHPHVEGTGMGLYLVKKILSNVGGSIQVESAVGRGTTFTVIFPT